MSCLKPGESLKIPSRAYDLITSQIKAKIENNTLAQNIVHDFPSIVKTKENSFNGVQGIQKEELNDTQEQEEDIEYEDNILSKFLVTERYDPANFSTIKQAINRELVTREVNKEVYKRHYLDELNQWKKRVR